MADDDAEMAALQAELAEMSAGLSKDELRELGLLPDGDLFELVEADTGPPAPAGPVGNISLLAAERRLALAMMFSPRLCAASPCRFLPETLKRELARSRTLGDAAVVVGGKRTGDCTASVLALDEALQEWRMLPDLPAALQATASCGLPGGGLLVVGGMDDKLDDKKTAYVLPAGARLGPPSHPPRHFSSQFQLRSQTPTDRSPSPSPFPVPVHTYTSS